MLLRTTPPLHLTYCLNVHPGETWPEVRAAIENHAVPIRRTVCPDRPFGLGLRLSRRTLDDLAAPGALEALRTVLREHDLYAFTLNGFPYGTFHGQAVKTAVYRPDWTDPRRLAYTRDLADVLASLLPEGVEGSISTVPLSYKAWPRDRASETRLFDHLAAIVTHCHRLRLRTGREIHLGLEPEPDCVLETTAETVAWFEGPLDREAVPRVASALGCAPAAARAIVRRHLGVCVDTCHLAIQYETPTDSLRTLAEHGIRVSKVQLSAALEADAGALARERLEAFCDPVYLHQVKCRATDGTVVAFPDLPEALRSAPTDGLWRIHFHVPLYFEGDGVLRSTAPALDAPFWATLTASPVSHLEIETYTFHVLPTALQVGGVTRSIAREFAWVLPRLTAATARTG
jgi:sugar phosphate isomerase/epimerase